MIGKLLLIIVLTFLVVTTLSIRNTVEMLEERDSGKDVEECKLLCVEKYNLTGYMITSWGTCMCFGDDL